MIFGKVIPFLLRMGHKEKPNGDIMANDVLSIVERDLSRYGCTGLSKAQIAQSSFSFSPRLHAIKAGFWLTWQKASKDRKKLQDLVYETLRNYAGLVPGKVITTDQWPQVFVDIRLYLANILYTASAEDVLVSVGGRDSELLLAVADTNSHHAFKSTEQVQDLKQQGKLLAEELADADGRSCISAIVREIERKYQETVIHPQYLCKYAQVLRRFYKEVLADSFDERVCMLSLTSEFTKEDYLPVTEIVDHIVETMVLLHLAHCEGKLYYPDTETNGECYITIRHLSENEPLTELVRNENIQTWITYFETKYSTEQKAIVDIKHCVYQAYQSL